MLRRTSISKKSLSINVFFKNLTRRAGRRLLYPRWKKKTKSKKHSTGSNITKNIGLNERRANHICKGGWGRKVVRTKSKFSFDVHLFFHIPTHQGDRYLCRLPKAQTFFVADKRRRLAPKSSHHSRPGPPLILTAFSNQDYKKRRKVKNAKQARKPQETSRGVNARTEKQQKEPVMKKF